MDKEKLILEIMKEAETDGEPVTREEAEEMAEMEIKNNLNRHYEKSDFPRKSKTAKERKIDPVKKKILACIKVLLEGLGAKIINVKTETEINFIFSNENYSLKLTKHRKKT